MKVSWDDDIPNTWKNKNVPNHQSAINGDIQKLLVLCHGKIPIENDDWGYPYDSGKLHTDIGDTQPKKVQWLWGYIKVIYYIDI